MLHKACHSHPAEDDRSHPVEDDHSHPAVDGHNHPAEDDRSHPAEDDRSHPAVDGHNHPAVDDHSHPDADHSHHPVGAGHNHPGAAGNHPRHSCYVGDSHPVGAVEHCSADLRRIPLDGTRLRRCYCDSCYDRSYLGVQQLRECVDVVNDLDDTLSERHPVWSLPAFSRCFRNPCVV